MAELNNRNKPKVNEVQERIENSLGNREARMLYKEKLREIPNSIDTTKPIEQQAKKAFEQRNRARTLVRGLMADIAAAEKLNKTDPNHTWDRMINKKIKAGFSQDEIFREILESSQRSRPEVNKKYGLE